MATTYPTTNDSFTDLDCSTSTRPIDVVNTIQDAVEALEAKVGANSSAVTTSHDYKLSGVTGSDKAVSKTGTETLTNKTLTSPTITTPSISSPVITNATTSGTNTGTETLSNKTLTSPVINTSVSGTAVLDEDNMASNSSTQIATQQSIAAAIASGWAPLGQIFTRITADSPSYQIRFSNMDLSGVLSPGMRIRWVQASIVRYGILQSVSFSTHTDCYLVTRNDNSTADYDVLDTASSAVTLVYISSSRFPYAFPGAKTNWQIEWADTNTTAQTPLNNATWYNINTALIALSYGLWDVEYQTFVQLNHTVDINGHVGVKVTLSTANNSESAIEWTSMYSINADSIEDSYATLYRRRIINQSTSGNRYLNYESFTDISSSPSISVSGAVSPTYLTATNAYL